MEYFRPEEFNHPDLIDHRVVEMLEAMRRQVPGVIITINSDVRIGDPKEHGRGRAVDFVIRDARTKKALPIVKQFLLMVRFFWTGIGIYPSWNEPGVHGDLRPRTMSGKRALWWRDEAGKYRALDEFFLL